MAKDPRDKDVTLNANEREQLISDLRDRGVSQAEAEMIADGAIWGLSPEGKKISNEMFSDGNGILGRLYDSVEGLAEGVLGTSFTDDGGGEGNQTTTLTDREQTLLDMAAAGDTDAANELIDGGGLGLEEFQRQNAAVKVEQGLAAIGAELNMDVTMDQVAEWIADYNRSSISPLALDDIDGFIARMDDPKMQYVFQESVLGVNEDVRRYQVGLGGGDADYAYLTANEQQFVGQLELDTRGIGLAVLGTKKFGLGLEESAAVAMTINSLTDDRARDDSGEIARLTTEVRSLQAEHDRILRSGNTGLGDARGGAAGAGVGALGEIRRKRDVAQEKLDRLNAQESKRNFWANRTASESFEKYGQITEQYDGVGLLGLIGLFDEELASKVYEGGGYDLTAVERKEIRDILGDAGNVSMPNTTSEQMNSVLFGNPTGAGPQTITYTAPDDSTLRESHRALYQSWFLEDPDEEDLAAFVADIQGQVRSEAMKRVTNSRVNFFKDPTGGGGGGPVVVGLEDVDFGNQQRENLRGNAQYADLFGNRPDGVSEEQYAGVFRNTATNFLGAEGVLATNATRQGMRSGETAAVARLSMYDKRFRDNSTLLGKMAGASNSFARFT